MRNAIDTETMRLIEDCGAALGRDDNVHVIVLTGAGDIAFSAGGDMKEMQEFSALSVDQLMEVWQTGLEVIEALAQTGDLRHQRLCLWRRYGACHGLPYPRGGGDGKAWPDGNRA